MIKNIESDESVICDRCKSEEAQFHYHAKALCQNCYQKSSEELVCE